MIRIEFWEKEERFEIVCDKPTEVEMGFISTFGNEWAKHYFKKGEDKK
jgi:hypothetical protein